MRLLITFLVGVATWAQPAVDANSGFRTTEQRKKSVERNIKGSEGRGAKQKPRELVAALGLKPGMTVVDLGTGIGYMLPYLSEAVGPAGRVIAIDIFEEFLAQAKKSSAERKLTNVEFILGGESDPRIPVGGADVVFTLDSYHHFNHPEKTMGVVRDGLKQGGRFALVDFYKSQFADQPGHMRLDRDDAIKEVEGFGFKLISRADIESNNQYIAILEKR